MSGAERIRAARVARGWSQEDLARAAGVSPTTVHRAEAALAVAPGSLAAICGALGLPAEELAATAYSGRPVPQDLADLWLRLPARRRRLAAAILRELGA